MKATLKSVAVALFILAAVMGVLFAVDNSANVSTASVSTNIRIAVVDLDGNPVHNAQVTVMGQTFNTDNKGLSHAIELKGLTNCYDNSITEWGTATVAVTKDGYVPAFAFNCICYVGQTRKLTIKIYNADSSELPYVSYVESPPDDYIKLLIK